MKTLILVAFAAMMIPTTKVEKVVETLHGVEVVDPYRWLENQEAPETREWLAAQEKYARSWIDGAPRRAAIAKRVEELMRVETVSFPTVRKQRVFYTRRAPEQSQPVLYVREGLQGKERMLVDPNARGGSISVSLLGVSADGTVLAYGLRKGGEDETEVQLLDVATGKDVGARLPRGRYMGVEIAPDNRTMYLSKFEDQGPAVYRQREGQAPERLFGDGLTAQNIIGIELSPGGKRLLLTVLLGSAGSKDEVYLMDLASKQVTTVNKEIDARFRGAFAGEETIVFTTDWKAPRQRVLTVPAGAPELAKAREIVPQTAWQLEGVSLVGGRIALQYLENVQSKIKLVDLQGKLVRELAAPGLGTATNLYGEWTNDLAFLSYNSFYQPNTIYSYAVGKGTQTEFARERVPVERVDVKVEQVWYTSKDGTKVPMFVAHRRDRKLDGSNPTLLTGYGGFTVTMTPGFSALYAWWIEQGGVVALPNLRGGSEFGEAWHQGGMLAKKQNTFDDFIAAAEWLIAKGYTRPERLAIRGGSNGGLLVGAAMTQRPELFGVVSCAVPLLDMVRYHLFKVARFWVPEYGSAEDAAQLRNILSYSPYQKVKDGVKYPATILITGDADTRVDPLHARKMAARLQAATGSGRPVILHYDTEGGHTQGLPLGKRVANLADELAFLTQQLGWE
ncbi:MAG: S9 family peptidase [Acidobacteriaceae bacterium]|nr:S9 family peptidase [Acidobacteriaceae bacterium]